jgi:ribose 5-phosphate isomerase B
MNLYLASDHAGYDLKEQIKQHLAATYPAHFVYDLGTDSTESVDYPDYGFKAGYAVAGDATARGIIICGSGIGISIAANRVAGVRAALCLTPEMAALARQHNNANIIALGARLTSEDIAKACVDVFLTTNFEGGRHEMRAKKLG